MMLSLFKVALACERRPISGRCFYPPKSNISDVEKPRGRYSYPNPIFFVPFLKQMMDIVMHVNLTFSQTCMFSTPHFSFFP